MPRPYIVRQIVRDGTVLTTYAAERALAADLESDRRGRHAHDDRRRCSAAPARPRRFRASTVAGKTGTATNPHGASHSWFVAFAPARASALRRCGRRGKRRLRCDGRRADRHATSSKPRLQANREAKGLS